MRTSRRLAAGLALVVAITSVGALPSAAQIDPPTPVDPSDLTPSDDATVEADGVVEGSKATSSTLAETDPALLGRDDGEVVEVMIKLDYDAIAVYGGGRDGLAATSPSVTGEPLDGADASSGAYARQVARDEAAIVADIEAAVPSADIGQSLRVVYGGVAARIPARDVEAVLAVDGVVAVQTDRVNQLLTDASPSFTGADDVWPQVGGQASAGNGVLFATLDTGVWPEHPSFADTGATPPAPPTNDGQPWQCLFGDNPVTPASDPFVCNDKLVGGRVFMDTHAALIGPDYYNGLTRDSDGHGTHTASTAAGNALASAPLLGTERGPVSGMAPGAWIAAYKVCGTGGCYSSDSTAAIGRAILDGVDVINFSIGGGADPATDPVELAFLDAYAAGVFVSASAGNSGPGADTVDHLGPWTTTVAATSPNRDFATTLTLSGGAGLTIPGVSISGTGVTTPRPVVLASAAPYNNAQCTNPAPPGLFTGKIVACERGPGRVTKSFNVTQGGAAGMILYNPTPLNISAESHWTPTIHIQDGPGLLAHVAANPGLTGTFGPGVKTASPGDEIAPFSSRGPGGLTIKPDVGAPGQNILAGHTPTPETASGGPTGNLFRIIDGTSMAAPHVAGAALLLRDAHPDWTPGQIRSALTGSASPTVTSGGSPATPFDTGSGRIQVDAAVAPGLLLDETAPRFATLGLDPANAVHLNLAQVSAPAMPGRLRTTRTVTNPGPSATYTAGVTAGSGTTITVEPSTFTLATGASQVVEIEIATDLAVGQSQFGRIVFTAPSRSSTHLPVSFTVAESEISLTGVGCTPDPLVVPQTSTCSFEIANEGGIDGLVDLRAEGDAEATVTGANLGATTTGGVATADDVALDGYEPGVPATAPGTSVAGYLPLDAFGIGATPIGDEQNINFNVPAFTYGDRTYTRIGINANGYIVVGGTDSAEDTNCCNLTAIGDPARPNNVLAPFWTDLDGGGAPGIYVTTLTDGVSSWIVVEWRVNVFGTNSRRIFQSWIGVNGVEDISFVYDPANSAAPFGQPVLVGAENRDGAGTTTVAPGSVPTSDMRVTSGPITPGAVVQWDVTVQGTAEGTGDISVEAVSNAHPGVLTAVEQLEVDPEPLPVVTDDPDDVTVDALDTATFTAAATGGTLARWERLPDGSATWETVSGASSTTLSFTAHGGDDGSQYRAVFANTTGGEVTTAAADLTVDRIDTTTSVTLSPTSPSRGQDVTFNATVSPSTATGTVQFALDGNPIGSPVAVASGMASSGAIPDIAAGPHSVTATFSGDVDHADSGDTETFSVVRNGSSTTIIEITSGVIGEDTPVDVTIRVVPAPEGGDVQLSVDGSPYGSPLTLDGNGEVETTITGLTPGSRTILAEFSGDDDLDPSDDEATITVYAAEEAFVRRAYQVMLGRNGDATGITYWVGRIEAGMDRTMLIDHFAGSREGRHRLVGRVFLTALDRSATADDRTYWAGRVAAGMTAEDLLATLLASAEGIDNAGGTAEGWVEKLFDAHLVREPTTAEVDYWVGRAEATLNIAQVRQLAKQFGRVPEATTVALSEAARLVCGVTTIPSGTADQLRSRWVTFGRHPVRLSGDTLALVCPSSSAPPT